MAETRAARAARELSYKAWYASQPLDRKHWLFAIANLCFKLGSDATTFKFMEKGDLSEVGEQNWWSRAAGQTELKSQLGSSVESFALHELAKRSDQAGQKPEGTIAQLVLENAPRGDNPLGTRETLGKYVASSIYAALGSPVFTFDDLEQKAKENQLKVDGQYNAFADWKAEAGGLVYVGELKTRWPTIPKDGRKIAIDPKAVVQSFQQARLYYKDSKNARPMLVYMCCPYPGTAARVAVFMPTKVAPAVIEVFENALALTKDSPDRCIQVATMIKDKVKQSKQEILQELAASPVRLALDVGENDASFDCGSAAQQRLALELVEAVMMALRE